MEITIEEVVQILQKRLDNVKDLDFDKPRDLAYKIDPVVDAYKELMYRVDQGKHYAEKKAA